MKHILNNDLKRAKTGSGALSVFEEPGAADIFEFRLRNSNGKCTFLIGSQVDIKPFKT